MKLSLLQTDSALGKKKKKKKTIMGGKDKNQRVRRQEIHADLDQNNFFFFVKNYT